MSQINRRTKNLIDWMIPIDFIVDIVIQDGATGDADDFYQVTINQSSYKVVDGTPGSDDSGTIATNLASAINAGFEDVSAAATGNVVRITSNEPAVRFSYSIHTNDEEGGIFAREITPEAYEVQQADNWDGSFTLMETVPRAGKVSPSLRGTDGAMNSPVGPNQVGFRFDPRDYSLDDNDVLFFRVAPVIGGITQAPRLIKIVLTPKQLAESATVLVLAGTVPAAVDFDSALKFVLPFQSKDVAVSNTGTTNDLKLAFASSPSELTVTPGSTFSDNRLNTGHLSLRGEGGPTDVEIYIVLNNKRAL